MSPAMQCQSNSSRSNAALSSIGLLIVASSKPTPFRFRFQPTTAQSCFLSRLLLNESQIQVSYSTVT